MLIETETLLSNYCYRIVAILSLLLSLVGTVQAQIETWGRVSHPTYLQ